nr:GspH/FimT family protein [Pseudomonas cremoricolorata]
MKQQGATLIQLSLALAIATGLALLGVTAYGQLREDLQLSIAARDLAQALRHARNYAVLHDESMLLEALEGDWGKGWQTLRVGDGQLLQERRLSRPLRIFSNGGKQVRFSALGIPLKPGEAFYAATLHLCRGARSEHQVMIASSGRIRLDTGAVSTPLCAAGPLQQ